VMDDMDGPSGAMWTATLPFVLPSEPRAVTVTLSVPPGNFAGALYRPLVEIVPVVELPPTTASTSHLTEVFANPETVAVYWRDWLRPTIVEFEVMVMVGAVADQETPQAAMTEDNSRTLFESIRIARTIPMKQTGG